MPSPNEREEWHRRRIRGPENERSDVLAVRIRSRAFWDSTGRESRENRRPTRGPANERSDVTESTKGKILGASGRYSTWLQHKYNCHEWEFGWNVQPGGGNNGPRDFLTKPERRKTRQAVLGKDGTPNYGTDSDLAATQAQPRHKSVKLL
jgi:hypothetical protein